jgi:hypothetical protein
MDARAAAAALDKELEAVADGADEPQGIGFINRDLSRYMTMVESADARPADSARARVGESCESLRASLARLRGAETTALPALNALLNKYGLAPLPAPTAPAGPGCVK